MANIKLEVNGAANQKSESVKKKIQKNKSVAQSAASALPIKETTGGFTSEVKRTTNETNGAYTPFAGPITSAQQLIRKNKNLNPKSIGYYENLGSYTEYLKTLTMSELQRHAIEDANISAVDDRARLIRRLETEWSGRRHKEAFGGATGFAPKAPAATPEQIAAHKELLKKTGRV